MNALSCQSMKIQVLLISSVVGALVEVFVVVFLVTSGFIRITGGGALPTPNLDKTFIYIFKGAMGAVFGFVIGIITYNLTREASAASGRLKYAILTGIVCGLVNSAIFSLLELNNALTGREFADLHDSQWRLITATAIAEFVAGVVIGYASFSAASSVSRH